MWKAASHHPQIVGDAHDTGGVGRGIGVGEQMTHLGFDLLRMSPVVGVVHGDELAGGFGKRAIACGIGASISGLAQNSHARVGESLQGGDRRIDARVIDHDDLDVAPGLGEQ